MGFFSDILSFYSTIKQMLVYVILQYEDLYSSIKTLPDKRGTRHVTIS